MSAEHTTSPTNPAAQSTAGVETPLPIDDVAVLKDLIDRVFAGVVLISPQRRIEYVNRLGRRLVTLPQGDPVGLEVSSFEPFTVWPDGSPCTIDQYPPVRCLATGEPQPPTTIGLRLPGDRQMWMTISAEPVIDRASGRVVWVLVTMVDSSHPKHIEDSLRQSEERYRRLVKYAPDAIIVHRGGKILFINDAAIKMWRGRNKDQFIGRNVLDFVHPKYLELARKRIERAMDGGSTPLVVQRQVRLDGRPLWVEVTGNGCTFHGEQCVQVFFRDVTRRRRAERSVRRAKQELEKRVNERTEQLRRMNAELGERHRFMQRSLETQELHRKLVAYEIHDTIVQDMIGALMYIDSIDCDHPQANPRDVERLDQARTLLRKSINEARRLISGLRPPIIDEQGIVGAIDYLVSEANGRGLKLRFHHTIEDRRLASAIETAIFRIAQEAINNIERHSQSSWGEIRLSEHGDSIRLEVSDQGVGFPAGRDTEGHFGLEGIKQRARLVGGTVRIESAPGQGTRVVAEVPIQLGDEPLEPHKTS